MAEIETDLPVHDEAGALSARFVSAVGEAIAAKDARVARELAADLHAADLADLIEMLDSDDRVALIGLLGRGFDAEALAELDEAVRDDLMEDLPPETIASAIRKLDTDDAIYLLEDLDKDEQQEILSKVSAEDRSVLKRALDYPEDTAGRLMQTEFVAVPESWTVARTLDYTRQERDLPDHFVEVYVVDPGYHLRGTVPVSRILRSESSQLISAIMDEEQTVFKVTDQQESVAYKFEQYNLVSAAVVDENERLVGMLMVDDIVDVIQEEAEEDLLHLGGVGDEAISDSVVAATRSRFSWLFVNLLTAVLASWVISWFDATIQQMVALAVLMPIVASQGGNAGTQTMTIAVRALATRELTALNAMRVVLREASVGLINGLVFAVIVGLFAVWWFGQGGLGLIIGAAMVINLIAAALAGILIPLTMNFFRFDPAIASGVFVTTVTDCVGFFAFLGLARIWIGG